MKLISLIKNAYEEKNGILGYRQMTIKLNREYNLKLNHKRIYRLMHILNLKSVCRRKRKNHIRSTPEITADNILNRKFESNKFGEKWLTDVTGMKYGLGDKAYLSAILDLSDKSIVSFVLGTIMNLCLKPLILLIWSTQMSSQFFKKKLDDAGMIQSMSRVSRCIDNGPMESFWGMLKSEMYYLRKVNTYSELETAVIEYIDYYNNPRYQKRLK
ncbi:MAG: IS3 family transposase [Clostridiaceae bacterium]|nr:IS3 family transposase [Clostridiaceae bacterium]MBW4860568.1 IS3 family transposase [Clostridiaceae bacterium]MBW4868484.1 IS3 family transposase [Clostridiaceae bacterium]